MSASETSTGEASASERRAGWRWATSPLESVIRWGLAASHTHVSRQLFVLICFSVFKEWDYAFFNAYACLLFRSLRGFSPWRPSRASRLLTMMRCRSPVWSFAVFLLQTSALPGGGGSETECWRRDRAHSSLLNRPQCHLQRCTRGLLFNCLDVQGPCFHENINLPEPLF